MDADLKSVPATVGAPSAFTTHRVRRRTGLWGYIRRYPNAALGALIVGSFTLIGLLAPWINPHDPFLQDYEHLLEGPTRAHPFGTDDLGRDVLSRVISGARVSMQVSFGSIALAVVVGLTVGLLAGYRGGWFDDIIMRVMDALYAFPTLILAIALVGALGPSLFNATLAISIVAMPRFARLIRGEVLRVRERDYIQAAKLSGARDSRIILRHVLPNTVGIVAIQAALSTAFAILTEANLSFLGLGVLPPTPSWGSMLRLGYPFIDQAAWLAVVPGAFITVTVLGFSLLGDGMRDLLDPRLRGVR